MNFDSRIGHYLELALETLWRLFGNSVGSWSAMRSSGRLYSYFECVGDVIVGFSALATERTSSFVNTAKKNGCDSRK